MPTEQPPRSILITGASSGIGKALALSYATAGITLFLSGRHSERLEETAEQCRKQGASVETSLTDVADQKTMARWIEYCDDMAPLDLVIANAGVSSDTATLGDKRDDAAIRTIFNINSQGVLNTVLPILPRMRSRRHGQIALMSSLASFRGLPNATAYCATKGMVRLWGESLRATLARDNIRVSVICPGFIRSRITDANRFSMPLFMEADEAARKIRNGLAANRGRIAFPWLLYLGVWILACCPDFLADWLTRRLPVKNSDL